jgi:phospholipid-binding lipoprotein MlaA
MKTRFNLSNAMSAMAKHTRWAGAAAVFALLAGCATGPNANPADPFEPFNRGVSRFNEGVDDAVLIPAATAYQKVLPSMVRTGVNNFFGNIGDVWSLANNVAQLKLQNSAETFMRLNVNTFFGLGGLLDVATEAGIPRHEEDFGQTLGHWGVRAGPYVVLPLLGPSTLRDTAAKPLDFYGDPLGYVEDIPWRNSLTVLRVVDTRSQYLQRRRSQVYDGNPPDDGAGNDK